MRKISIINTVTSYMTLIIIITALSLSYFWIYLEYVKFSKEAASIRKTFTNIEKNILKNEVNKAFNYIKLKQSQTEKILKTEIKNRTYEAYNLANQIYSVGKSKNLSDEEIKKNIIEILRPLRFNDGRGYFFIADLNGKEILYPIVPELENKNIINLKDEKGNFVLKKEINLIKKQNEGFIEGYWKKPEDKSKKIYRKISFVKKLDKYNWYVGTGEYLDTIEKKLQQDVSQYISSIRFGTDKDQYIFVTNYNGVEIINGKYPEIVGKNVFSLEKTSDLKSIQSGIKMAKEKKSGYITQVWYDDDLKDTSKKLSYILCFPEWKWTIGSGIYLNKIEKKIKRKKQELIKHIKKEIINIFIIIVVLIILNTLIIRIIKNKITKNFNLFYEFFKTSLETYDEIDIDKIHYIEFEKLASSANLMINDKKRLDEELKLMNENLKEALNDRNEKLENISKNINKFIDVKKQTTSALNDHNNKDKS